MVSAPFSVSPPPQQRCPNCRRTGWYSTGGVQDDLNAVIIKCLHCHRVLEVWAKRSQTGEEPSKRLESLSF